MTRIDDIKRTAQSARGTFGPACMTCAFHRPAGAFRLFDECRYFCTLNVSWERTEHGRCGPEGRAWEPRPPRLGLISRVRRLLWGDPR